MTGKPGELGERSDTLRGADWLVEGIRQVALAPTRQERKAALDELAATVAEAGALPSVLNWLISGDVNSQRFALELIARLPPPNETAAERILPLLIRRDFPSTLRLRVVA